MVIDAPAAPFRPPPAEHISEFRAAPAVPEDPEVSSSSKPGPGVGEANGTLQRSLVHVPEQRQLYSLYSVPESHPLLLQKVLHAALSPFANVQAAGVGAGVGGGVGGTGVGGAGVGTGTRHMGGPPFKESHSPATTTRCALHTQS